MSQPAFDPARRQLLRGDAGNRRTPVRPPWSVAEQQFIDNCSRCGDCINHCPEQILIKGSGGFPEIDFQRGECTFCQQCVNSCQAPVFIDTQQPGWNLKAQISDRCIAYNHVVCRSCAEQCEPEAIQIKPQPGGVGTPLLDPDRCTGCGACVSVCPTQAIEIRSGQDSRFQSPVNSQQQS